MQFHGLGDPGEEPCEDLLMTQRVVLVRLDFVEQVVDVLRGGGEALFVIALMQQDRNDPGQDLRTLVAGDAEPVRGQGPAQFVEVGDPRQRLRDDVDLGMAIGVPGRDERSSGQPTS